MSFNLYKNLYYTFSYYIKSCYIFLEKKLEDEYYNLSLWYFFSFMAGIIAYFTLEHEPSNRRIITIFASSLATLYLKRKYGLVGKFFSYLIISFVVGILISKYQAITTKTYHIYNQITTTLEGNIESIENTLYGKQMILSSITLHNNSNLKISKIKMNIENKYISQQINIGDRIIVTARLYPPQSSIVIGGYDFGFYAHFANISASGYAKGKLLVIKYNNKLSIKSIVNKAQLFVYNKLTSTFSDIPANFLAALILGQTKTMNQEVMNSLRLTGVSHVLCVSGLHLSLVAMTLFISMRFILNLFDMIAYRFNIKLISAIFALIGSYGYLILSGMHIAATRAFIMTAIFIIAITINRSPYNIRSLALSAAFILTINPEYIFHPSFQLSFIAVLALIYGYEFYLSYQRYLDEKSYYRDSKEIYKNKFFHKITLYILTNIYSSFLASTITAPLVINQFYNFPLYSIPMNLIVVPIVSILLIPLSIVLVFLMIFDLDFLLKNIMTFFINIIVDTTTSVSAIDHAVLNCGYINPLSIIVFMSGIAWICFWKTRWRFFGLPIIILSVGIMLFSPKPKFIVDMKQNSIGLINKEGKLEIYSNHISEFQKQYWISWFGQKSAIVNNLDKNISINDIQMFKDFSIANNINISSSILKKYRIIAVFCNKFYCSIKHNNNRFIAYNSKINRVK